LRIKLPSLDQRLGSYVMYNLGITRHIRDLDRLKTIQAVVDREMKPGRAAERLDMGVRQIERLVIRYRTDGPLGLISRHRNRTGNRALKAPLAEHIVAILRERYPDFGPTLAAEKLEGRHGVRIAKETVRQLQIASGLGHRAAVPRSSGGIARGP
jgi:transposase